MAREISIYDLAINNEMSKEEMLQHLRNNEEIKNAEIRTRSDAFGMAINYGNSNFIEVVLQDGYVSLNLHDSIEYPGPSIEKLLSGFNTEELNTKILKILLEAGADPNKCLEYKPLSLVSKLNEEQLKLLVEYGATADFDTIDIFLETISLGHTVSMKELSDNQVNDKTYMATTIANMAKYGSIKNKLKSGEALTEKEREFVKTYQPTTQAEMDFVHKLGHIEEGGVVHVEAGAAAEVHAAGAGAGSVHAGPRPRSPRGAWPSL